MPIDHSRLMSVVSAGQSIAAVYKTLVDEMIELTRLASMQQLDLPTMLDAMNRRLIGAKTVIIPAEHIFDIEQLRWSLTHKQNERVRRNMARLRAKKRGEPYFEPGPQHEPTPFRDQVEQTILQPISVRSYVPPRSAVKVKGPSRDIEYDPATQEQIEMAQGLRPIDNPNDDVTAALSVAFGDPTLPADGGASLQFEVAASPPTAEEQAQALAEALAAETPDEFKPKGLTALEFNGMKLI